MADGRDKGIEMNAVLPSMGNVITSAKEVLVDVVSSRHSKPDEGSLPALKGLGTARMLSKRRALHEQHVKLREETGYLIPLDIIFDDVRDRMITALGLLANLCTVRTLCREYIAPAAGPQWATPNMNIMAISYWIAMFMLLLLYTLPTTWGNRYDSPPYKIVCSMIWTLLQLGFAVFIGVVKIYPAQVKGDSTADHVTDLFGLTIAQLCYIWILCSYSFSLGKQDDTWLPPDPTHDRQEEMYRCTFKKKREVLAKLLSDVEVARSAPSQ